MNTNIWQFSFFKILIYRNFMTKFFLCFDPSASSFATLGGIFVYFVSINWLVIVCECKLVCMSLLYTYDKVFSVLGSWCISKQELQFVPPTSSRICQWGNSITAWSRRERKIWRMWKTCCWPMLSLNQRFDSPCIMTRGWFGRKSHWTILPQCCKAFWEKGS